jgi:carotenoid 1,2-hydratase
VAGFVRAAGGGDETAGPVSGGGCGASGAGPADGGDLGADRGGVRFDLPVENGGYAWWYVDAISDDGAHALTLIAFIGSVFSPYYDWANRRAPAPAENFCAMNMVLYRPRGGHWAMTERSRRALTRSAEVLRIGPSALHWDGTTLRAEIDERCAPLPRRLRGTLTLTPGVQPDRRFALDEAARHRWRPIAPQARVTVDFQSPAMSWSGHAYFDHNAGDRPLAADFASWHWSRSPDRILYDVTRADGTSQSLALAITDDGALTPFAPPPVARLPKTFWGVERLTRADPGTSPAVIKTLEDAPFYARSLVGATIGGKAATYVHESLSLARFSQPWVRLLLPFRMPRLG